MTRRVIVVGGGIAGTAATWAARRSGAEVTLVRARAGATHLASGAVDDAPWERAGAGSAPLDADVAAFLDALGALRVGAERALVATLAGRLRPARGADRAVLDLAAIRGTVAVPRCDRAGWDADALAAAWSDDPRARARGLRFEPVEAPVLRHAGEARIPDVDLAARHDDPGCVAWLGERLAERVRGAAAVLLGPWLGLGSDAPAVLAARVGVPVGEPLSPPGGAAGARLARACDRLVAATGAAVREAWARSVEPGARAAVSFEDGARLEADAVVLAVGGVAGGGVALAATDPTGPRGRPAFVATLASPCALAMHGAPLAAAASPYGPAFEDLAWSAARGVSALEAVGYRVDPEMRSVGAAGTVLSSVRVAGDAVADRPRTVLEAVRSGLAAAAAREISSL